MKILISLLLSYSIFALVPYDLPKFQQVLDDSKLQAPTSTTACPQGQFAGYDDTFFRLDASDTYMTFTMSGDSHRSELRQMIEWKTSTSNLQTMEGEVKVFYPTTSSLNELTFMQIHDSGTSPNKPLLRLAWIRSRSSKSDHLWAIIRKSTSSSSSYEYVDLGARPSGFFHAKVQVMSNYMRLTLNDNIIFTKSVSYWSALNNYFKAGVYLQDNGTGKVQFKTLNYYYN